EVDEVSPHILRWKDSFGNMYIIRDDNCTALLVDAGIIHYEEPQNIREEFLSSRLDKLIRHYKIKKIEAVIISHYHGDHFDILPFMQKKYNVKIWCYENMVEVIEHPERYNLTALLPWYGIHDKLKVDRVLHDGECVEWGGYRMNIVHLPGQTWYGMGMAAVIDGVFTAFTGDNLFYSEKGSGHEAFFMRNRAILEEGYIKCAEVLKKLEPERILCGHSYIIGQPGLQLENFHKWAYGFRKALESFSPYSEYELTIDPYWVEVYPYISRIRAGKKISKKIRIHNYHKSTMDMKGRLCCPEGWTVVPELFKVQVNAQSSGSVDVLVKIPASTPSGRYAVTVDITDGDMDFGEMFDGIVEVEV
ncbi:MAG: MBL fold metallo-hydrolase, partial [Clostridiales bacterium]|nr:MBL fold metallo-hydrolase [Clostridiales bacterium]